jgi:hypothetical protein
LGLAFNLFSFLFDGERDTLSFISEGARFFGESALFAFKTGGKSLEASASTVVATSRLDCAIVTTAACSLPTAPKVWLTWGGIIILDNVESSSGDGCNGQQW